MLIAKMFLQFVFTSLLINSLCFVSEGSVITDIGQAFNLLKSDLNYIKSELALIKADQQIMRSDLGILRSDQHQIKSDQQQIKSEIEFIKNEVMRCKPDQENTKLKTTEIGSDTSLIREDLKRVENALKSFNQSGYIGRSCAEEISISRGSGIYDISIPGSSKLPFKVACDAETRGGKWTIILRRMDGSENFNRNWTEYKKGFGNLTGEFFLGLQKIHALTNDQPQELLVLLEDFEGETRYETYDAFAIGAESELYKLHTVGNAAGTAGDSLSHHRGMSFTSYDRDNDERENPENRNCAELYTGGWWYRNCHWSNLMGVYKDNGFGKGVNWGTFQQSYSMKRAIMMIRPRKL